MGRFGLGRFDLSRFGPGSFRPILVSRFGLIFLFNRYILYNILNARCVCYTRLVVLQGYLGLLQGEKLHLYSIKNDRETTMVTLCFRYKDSTIILFLKSEISRLWPAYVTVQAGL